MHSKPEIGREVQITIEAGTICNVRIEEASQTNNRIMELPVSTAKPKTI
jgi:hypothetical protein